jgi:endonuclease/exonuclease/phosphatase family metal-dependent hydrolase
MNSKMNSHYADICKVSFNTFDMGLKYFFMKTSGFFRIAGCALLSGFILLAGFNMKVHAQKETLSVLTYNIRLATPDDAPNIWSNRKENVFSLIREASPDVFGLQEALKEQVYDFDKAFPSYSRVGVGRDDGKAEGEFSPVYYNSKKYNALSSGTFWLSQTPEIAGSRGWDAACNRVVSWVQLKEGTSGKPFFVFCTHFDHMGEVARRNSAKLLIHAVDSLAGKNPAVVVGDFNATPGSEPYQRITEKSDSSHLTDALMLSAKVKGPEYTYTGFKVGGIPGQRIDYIFLKNIPKVKKYAVNDTNNGVYYPSDHLPVSAKLILY